MYDPYNRLLRYLARRKNGPARLVTENSDAYYGEHDRPSPAAARSCRADMTGGRGREEPRSRPATAGGSTKTSGYLPAELTSFVGRREELKEIRGLVGSARLVTLTGVGGVGKTRLALQAAQSLARSFKDGVWFVGLASLKEPDLVAAAVCQSMNIWDQSARWTREHLADYLADRRALLVLDNCEHLIDACASLCEDLLRKAPELHILATSRQALSLIGEAIVRVPPLTLPVVNVHARSDMAQHYEALQLFSERASMAVPGFAVDDANIDAVVEICRRLDGIPLAIELVTARLRSMGLNQVLAGLGDRYRLLARATRTTVPRQQTLRALVDWSYDLCSGDEQTLWRRLSVFSGSFELDAAKYVCGDEGISVDVIPDVISSLAEKSILLLEPGPTPRYRLLDTIRDYGADRLHAATDAGDLGRRHRDYYSGLVERANQEWLSDRQVGWLNRLRQEHPNVRGAMQYSLQRADEAEAGMEMAARLWAFWIAAGALGEGRRWLERFLGRVQSRPSRSRERALWVVSYITACQGDLTAADAWLAEGKTIATDTGDRAALVYLALASGLITMFHGDVDQANALLSRAVDDFRELDEPIGAMDAQFLLGCLASVSGDVDRALDLVRATLVACEQFGERWWRAWAERNLAVALWRAGDRKGSTEAVLHALSDCRDLNEQLCGALCLEVCAWIAAAERRYRRAAILFGATRGVWEALSTTPFWQLAEQDAAWEQVTRLALGDAAFAEAVAEGQQLAAEDALDYGLGHLTQDADADANRRSDDATSLTPRELEVAHYVAEGMNNKEIASRLVISRRTAETHVEHILAKLGFTNRAQIAAWVAGHRLNAVQGTWLWPTSRQGQAPRVEEVHWSPTSR